MDNYKTAFDAGEECASNAEHLCNDANTLHEAESYGSAMALAILSQEEAGKALLLAGAVTGMLPFQQSVFTNTRQKHHVKQALGLLCELVEQADSEIGLQSWIEKRIDESEFPSDDTEPESVDAVEIFESTLHPDEVEKRFEEFFSSHERAIDEKFGSIKSLDKDRRKQSGLYVDIDRDGQVTSRPSSVTPDISRREIETARRAITMLRGLTNNWTYDFKAYEVSRLAIERYRGRIRARN